MIEDTETPGGLTEHERARAFFLRKAVNTSGGRYAIAYALLVLADRIEDHGIAIENPLSVIGEMMTPEGTR